MSKKAISDIDVRLARAVYPREDQAVIATAGDALYEDVVASPSDDGPRLIYADWLEENGQELRAEFIKVQIELARVEAWLKANEDTKAWPFDHARRKSQLVARQKELLTPANFWGWFDPLPGWPGMPGVEIAGDVCEVGYWNPGGVGEPPHWWLTVARGFVHTIRLTQEDWLTHGKALVKQHPLQRVELSDEFPRPRTVMPDHMKAEHGWYRGDLDPALWAVVAGLYADRLVPATDEFFWPTKAVAQDRLSYACLLWAREAKP